MASRVERQLLIDDHCTAAGGPLYYTGYYTGRDMKLSQVGMGTGESDRPLFTGRLAVLDHLSVGGPERGDVLGFIETLKGDIVEC